MPVYQEGMLVKLPQIERALRQFIAGEIDYDTHKYLEEDEVDGKDHYPRLAVKFFEILEASK